MLTKNPLPSYYCFPLLCSISHCKDPFMSKSARPGNTHLSHTVTSYTQLGLIQDFPSECGKLTAVGRWGRQWWGTERTIRCGACDAVSPSQVPGKIIPPRLAANSPCPAAKAPSYVCGPPTSEAPTTMQQVQLQVAWWPSRHWSRRKWAGNCAGLSRGPANADQVIYHLPSSRLLWRAWAAGTPCQTRAVP